MKQNSFRNHNPIFLALLLAVTLIATGCGGGGGGDDSSSSSSGGGTGSNSVTSRSSGEIEAFGSIIINGKRFEIENVELEIEGERFEGQNQAGVEDRLRRGMVVEVEAEGTDDNTVRRATRIKFEDTLEGPISAIVETIPGSVKTFTVLGQAVIVENGVTQPSTSFTAFSVGDVVEVSGLRSANGAVNATFIEAKPAGGVLEITGVVSNLSGSTFQINGLTVNFAGAVLSNGTPADGLLVEAKGTVFTSPPPTLTATSVEVKNQGLGDADEAEVEGFITSVDLAAGTFVVNGQTVNFASAVFRSGVAADLAVGTKVEAEGSIVNGILLAEKVTFKAAVKIEGNIASVAAGAGNAFTVTIDGLPGISVAVDDNLTEFRPLDDNPANTPPAVGNNVRIRARESGTGVLLAQRFEVESPGPDNRLILQGLVDSFSADGGGTVTILGIVVGCSTIENADFKREEVSIGRAAFFADLLADDLVKARARLGGPSPVWEEIEFELPDDSN
jgi:hypothetical protein